MWCYVFEGQKSRENGVEEERRRGNGTALLYGILLRSEGSSPE